ncbi:hypothetical protein [uncultured Hymenobacter sp.]|uniref:hypothetical protein n=1 Tax=uncultured Hymenobacter sp. TaxID=170016 RepID=UPI0035CC7FC6
MEAIQLHARAEAGKISVDLPAEHLNLANAEFLVLLVPYVPAPTPPTRFKPTDWEALRKAYEAFEGHDPYPTVTDPVAWQREIRGEWDRDETPQP